MDILHQQNVDEMDTLTLTSIPYKYSVVVSKSHLLELFPDSLFVLTLQQDPSADTIDIPNPIVTPDVLDVVKYMVDNNNTPLVTPGDNWFQAGKYLLMDVIMAMSEPEYPTIKQKTQINLLDVPNIERRYGTISDWIKIYPAPHINEYILNHIPHIGYDQALDSCDFKVVRSYIERGDIIPSNEDLIFAISPSM